MLLTLPTAPTDPVSTGVSLLKYGEPGIVGAVILIVLIVIHRLVEKSRDAEALRAAEARKVEREAAEKLREAEAARLKDQLTALAAISQTNLETARLQAAALASAGQFVREIERHTEALEEMISKSTTPR